MIDAPLSGYSVGCSTWCPLEIKQTSVQVEYYVGDNDWKKSCLLLEKKSSFTCRPVPPVSSDSSVSSY